MKVEKVKEVCNGIKNKEYILVIYDVAEDRKRTRLAKYLQGFGSRVQKSAFEMYITKQKYALLLDELPKLINDEDSVRIYRLGTYSIILSAGKEDEKMPDEVIIA